MKVGFQTIKSVFSPKLVKHIPSEKRVYRNIIGYTKKIEYDSTEISIKKSFLGIPLVTKKKSVTKENNCKSIDKWIELFNSKNMAFTYKSRIV